MKFLLVFVAATLLSVDPGYAQDSFQEMLLSQEKSVVDAIQRKDRPVLKKLLGAESFAVTPGGGRQTGAEMLRSLDQVPLTQYSLSEVKSVKVSPDVGILSYKFTWFGSHDGAPATTTTVWATSTWVRRDGNWTSVFYQETPLRTDD